MTLAPFTNPEHKSVVPGIGIGMKLEQISEQSSFVEENANLASYRPKNFLASPMPYKQ